MQTEYDVIIAGAGAAGLYAALHFPADVRVLLLSKRTLTLSNSSLAQGGVAAVLDRTLDDYKLHIADTLIAGGYKNNLGALEILVTEGPDDVNALRKLGVGFDQDENGRLQMTLEGGHSRRRIVHHKDTTGREIVDTLLTHVRARENVDIAEDAMLCGLHKEENGFFADVLSDGTVSPVTAHFCLLATGGIGRVYESTTNSAIATGDGIAFAHLLGARIKNLSLVQFHPTAFAAAEGRERFLISEAVRGEGAVLLNADGNRFMDHYDYRGELAPRDVVSRAILLESERSGSDKFYLDISFREASFLKERFPMIYACCLEEGIDITKEPIPVFPCQHYLMGGVDVDVHSKTSVERLYACGECAHTGVHGLNRLASNSLLEALVFSRRAARTITQSLLREERRPVVRTAPPPTGQKRLPTGLRTEIRHIMQGAYFVRPDSQKIRTGAARIHEIMDTLLREPFILTSDTVEARSLSIVADLILKEVLDQ